MKKTVGNICLLAFLFHACLTAVSCKGPAATSDEDLFFNQPSVCMVVGTKEYIGPSSGILQTSCNAQKHIYRAGIPIILKDQNTGLDVEIVEEYFVAVLDAVPGESGSKVNGNISLKSNQLRSGYQTYPNVEFTIKKTENDLAWLWAAKEHIGLVIKVL